MTHITERGWRDPNMPSLARMLFCCWILSPPVLVVNAQDRNLGPGVTPGFTFIPTQAVSTSTRSPTPLPVAPTPAPVQPTPAPVQPTPAPVQPTYSCGKWGQFGTCTANNGQGCGPGSQTRQGQCMGSDGSTADRCGGSCVNTGPCDLSVRSAQPICSHAAPGVAVCSGRCVLALRSRAGL